MDNLTAPNQLFYFTKNDINSTIGLSIVNNKPIMWFRERDDLVTRTKIIKPPNDAKFLKDDTTEKLIVRFGEYDSTCMCSNISNKFLSIITLNTDVEHKATYKLQLFKIVKIGVKTNNYIDNGTYYSYFA